MKTVRHGRLAVVAVATLAACTSIQVGSERDPEGRFSTYSSFYAAPAPETAAGVDRYNLVFGQVIRSEIIDGISSRGMREVGQQEADLEVHFEVAGEDDVAVTGSYRDTTVAPYVKATLTIRVVERERDRLVWHGWGSLRIFREREGFDRAREVTRAVVARFP